MVSRLVQDDSAARGTVLPDEAFGELTSPYRRELLVHCYRMLGSIDDAEDAVQDALVRAWQGRGTYRHDLSLRAWLYRIATNACLDAIARRRGGRRDEQALGVGPYPDELLGRATAGPEARYDAHESISLAFLTVLQLLPPRQRAVLILRDVLGWRAAEVAALIDLSVPAVNSSLHRARMTMSSRYASSDGEAHDRADAGGRLRSLLDRYVRAWEAADVAGLVALLREDAVVSMPPALTIVGARAVGDFLAGSVFRDAMRFRLVPVRANDAPAFVIYSGAGGDAVVRPYAVLLLDAIAGQVARMTVFTEPGLIARFGVPVDLPA
jgi:RNA polymerase sigma-70 factor (ECF subfamily)